MTAPVAGAAGRAVAGKGAAARAPTGSAPTGASSSASGAGRRTLERHAKRAGDRQVSNLLSAATGGAAGSKAGGVLDKLPTLPKELDKQHPGFKGGPARKLLLAEFAMCAVVVTFSPATDKHRDDTPGALMKRFSAVMVAFFVLALIASGGRGAARAAAGFGGLLTLALLLSNRDLFVVMAKKFTTHADELPEQGPGPNLDEQGNPVSDAGDLIHRPWVGP